MKYSFVSRGGTDDKQISPRTCQILDDRFSKISTVKKIRQSDVKWGERGGRGTSD